MIGVRFCLTSFVVVVVASTICVVLVSVTLWFELKAPVSVVTWFLQW